MGDSTGAEDLQGGGGMHLAPGASAVPAGDPAPTVDDDAGFGDVPQTVTEQDQRHIDAARNALPDPSS